MRKVTEERVEHVVTHKEVFCDLCGAQTAPNKGFDGTETLITTKEGDIYPEVDCREATYADVCSECFRKKVVPALQAIGVKFYTGYVDEF